MKSKPIKNKPCTKKCKPGCLANRANHIPHEHFIMALSFLVISLSGLIITTGTADAKQTVRKVSYVTTCVDPDKNNATTKGATALIKYNKLHRADSKIIKQQFDQCLDTKRLKEFKCNKNTISYTITKCPNGYTCSEGACQQEKAPASQEVTTLNTTTSSAISASSTRAFPSNNSILIGNDGTWCNIRQAQGSPYFGITGCEDSRGTKGSSMCSGDELTKYECTFEYDTAGYKNVQCKKQAQNCSWMGGQCITDHCEEKKTPQKAESAPTVTSLSCNDTDGGANVDIKGTLSISNNAGEIITTKNDECTTDEKLTEYACTPGAERLFSATALTCESGICSNGACVTLTSSNE